MNHKRRASRRPSLDSIDEEDLIMIKMKQDDLPPQEHTPQRKLIDYTVSTRQRLISEKDAFVRRLPPSPSKPKIDLQTNKLVVPSLNYVEKIPYGPVHITQQEDSLQNNDERIDFFLKLQKRRAPTTKIQDFRAGLEKSRLQKSRLFGAFAGNGVRRSSYTDLKRAWSTGKQVCALTF